MIDEVEGAIRAVADSEVVARFRSLRDGEIDQKTPGDFVTVADRECERVLGAELRAIRDVPVVGEEATELNPSLPSLLSDAPAAWVVDPIDGTANFVDGSPDFAVMVAYVEHGATTAAWIWLPIHDQMLTARRGDGTYLNRVRVERRVDDPGQSGIIKHKYIPEPARSAVVAVADALSTTRDRRCAGVEYTELVQGGLDFLFYWRTKPWDHAPGALLAAEAGLRPGRLDGSPYRAGTDELGLLTARPEQWETISSDLRRSVPKRA